MYFPRNALLSISWLLGAILSCPTLADAFPSQTTASPSDDAPFSVSILADKMRPRVAILQASLERNPNQADVLVELGEELEQIGDLSRALAAYDDALRARPDDSRAFYGFWHVRFDLRARETDTASKASGHGATTVRRNPTVPRADRGEPREQSDTFEASLDQAGSLAAANLDDIEEKIRLGRKLLGAGEVEAAIVQYEMALASRPSHAGARLDLARALMLKRRWPQARDHLEQVVRLQPDLARAHYALGLVRYTLSDVPGSIDAYNDALRADPMDAQAHYQFGLLLRLSGRDGDAFGHLLEAAHLGVPKAQYLVGAAYRSGHGVSADLRQAVAWWFRAADQGLPSAREGLAQLRLGALRGAHAQSIQAAFRWYRDSFWEAHPSLGRSRPDQPVGLRLLQRGRAQEALPILIKEARALSSEAHRVLEILYEVGFHGFLDPHDERILEFFEETAAESLPRSRLVLGRIYFEGLGVTADPDRARRLLGSHWSRRIAEPNAWLPIRSTWHGRSAMSWRMPAAGAAHRDLQTHK